MNNFVNITSIDFPLSKEEIKIEMEINNLFLLIEDKKKEKEQLSTKRINEFLIKNNTGFSLGEIIYNIDTHEKFIVDSLEPFHVSLY